MAPSSLQCGFHKESIEGIRDLLSLEIKGLRELLDAKLDVLNATIKPALDLRHDFDKLVIRVSAIGIRVDELGEVEGRVNKIEKAQWKWIGLASGFAFVLGVAGAWMVEHFYLKR